MLHVRNAGTDATSNRALQTTVPQPPSQLPYYAYDRKTSRSTLTADRKPLKVIAMDYIYHDSVACIAPLVLRSHRKFNIDSPAPPPPRFRYCGC